MASLDEKGTLLIYDVKTDGTSTTLSLYKKIDGFYVGAKAIDWADNKRICAVGSSSSPYARAIHIDTEANLGDFSAAGASLSTVSIRTQRPLMLAAAGEIPTVNFFHRPPL